MDLGALRRIFRDELGAGHPDVIQARLPKAYAQHWRRLWALFGLDDGDLAAYCRARNLASSTFYCLKAAALKYLALEGLKHVYAAASAQKGADILEQQLNRSFATKFADYLQQLKTIPPYRQPSPVPKASQRKALKGLPPDWRERLANVLPKRWVPFFQVLAATGCRPEELSKGVTIQPRQATITVRISGAKVDEQKGQAWREIELAADSLFASELPEGRVHMNNADYPAFRKAFNRAARQLWPRRAKVPAPYALRHQFAADAKAVGVSYETLAKALGHSVTRTQQLYGHSKQGSGRVRILDAQAARPIKRTHHTFAAAPGPGPRMGM